MDYYLRYVLDETTRALEPVWKPAITSGKPVAVGNEAGLTFLLERLTPAELAAVPASAPVHRALVSRAGVEPGQRQAALAALAVAARTHADCASSSETLGRLDGTPGTGAASIDLGADARHLPTSRRSTR